jgi:hypothetical protein
MPAPSDAVNYMASVGAVLQDASVGGVCMCVCARGVRAAIKIVRNGALRMCAVGACVRASSWRTFIHNMPHYQPARPLIQRALIHASNTTVPRPP